MVHVAPAVAEPPKLPPDPTPVAPAPTTWHRVKIHKSPSRAQLRLDGVLLSGEVAQVPADGSPHELRVSAAGYEDAIVVLDEKTPGTLDIGLRRRSGHAPSRHEERSVPPSADNAPLDP